MSSQPRPRSFLRTGKSIFSVLHARGGAHKVSTSPFKREASPLNPNRQKRRKTISFAPSSIDGSGSSPTPTTSPFSSTIEPRERQTEEDEALALWLSQYLVHEVHGEETDLASESDLLEQVKVMLLPILRCLKPVSEVVFFALHLLRRAFPRPIPEADVRFLNDAAIIMIRLFALFLRLSSAWLEEIGALRDEIRTAHLVYWMHLDKLLVHRSLIQTLHILDHDLTISQVAWSLQLEQFRSHIERYMQAYNSDLFSRVRNLVMDLERRYPYPSSGFEDVNMHSQSQNQPRKRVMDFLTMNLPKHRCDLTCVNWPTVYPLEPVDPDAEGLVVIPSSLSAASIISVYDIPDDEALYDLKQLEKTMSTDHQSLPPTTTDGMALPSPHNDGDGLTKELTSPHHGSIRQRFSFRGSSRNSSDFPACDSSSSKSAGSPAADDTREPGPQPSRWLSPATIAQLGRRPLKLSFITGGRSPVSSPASPME
ncbi:hypothetical protein D9758_004396 [Tetrapyrgos nigripes]|uniref:Uncharacterized protein n=1 Tax=Tetrapyrgos nigripes TaxID=182062 RepID=A0A8H5LS35_9AGAR|nr:hypothetical protein D9758_004396 [Tetrapyrgos nigripes]